MRALPVGDRALLVELSSGDEAQALHAELLRRRAEGLLSVHEIVPAARTVLLDGLDDPARLASELTTSEVPPAPPRARTAIDIPVRYDVPRRATPRTAVPAGSVALAGPYTGVYPRSSPGGWQLIGRTDAVLWDHTRVPAALLSPGTRVRFVPVDGS